jgi:predicted RNA-binding Zn-ribbon protein involved in translation (DUF1610 family)
MNIDKTISEVTRNMKIKDATLNKASCSTCGYKLRYSQSSGILFCPKCLEEK